MIAHLKASGFVFELFEHPAVFTVEEAQKHTGHIPGVHCKNLFLKCQKTEKLFLVTVPDERVVDLKALPEKIGAKKFSFGRPELLMEVLGVLPGSVTPLALINDAAKRVTPVLDAWMMQQELLNYHPLINTATVTMRPADMRAFMEALGYQPVLLDLEKATRAA
jgi:Ala-tRNA(Pro) deacylase